MIEVLEHILHLQHIYFAAIFERVKEFEGKRNENGVNQQIYRAYYSSYDVGRSALHHFDAALEQARAGNYEPLKTIAGSPVVPNTRAGAIVVELLSSTRLPSQLFRARLHFETKQIAQGILYLLTYTPENDQLLEDLDTIACLLASFEHTETDPDTGGGGSLWSKALPFAGGVIAGSVGKSLLGKVYESLKGSFFR